MTEISHYLSVITLSVNDLNTPSKRQTGRMDQGTKCCIQETHSIKNKLTVQKLKVKEQYSMQQKPYVSICLLVFVLKLMG